MDLIRRKLSETMLSLNFKFMFSRNSTLTIKYDLFELALVNILSLLGKKSVIFDEKCLCCSHLLFINFKLAYMPRYALIREKLDNKMLNKEIFSFKFSLKIFFNI